MASASAGDPRTDISTQVAVSHVPALEVGVATDPGKMPEKQVNEDSANARVTRHGHLAVVCDGMGGHVGGREASQLAVETVFRCVDAASGGTPGEILAQAIREANHAVYSRGQSPDLKGMGSTCVAVLTHPGGTEVAHVGDSRVYLLTQQQLYQVTKDHSLVQRLVDANMLTPEEAPNHPSANQITNALGMKPDCEVEVRPSPFVHTPGDTFILCSDGLSDEIGPQDMLQILAPNPTADQAARAMVDLANARGGHDNITVVIVRLSGGQPFVPHMPTSRAPTPIAGLPVVNATGTMEMPAVADAIVSANATMAQAPIPLVQSPHSSQRGISTAPGGAPPMTVVPQFTPPPPPMHPHAAAAFEGSPTSMPIAHGRRKGNGVLIAIIVVLVLALGAVGGLLYLKEHQGSPTETKPSANATETDEPVPSTTEKKTIKPKPPPTSTVNPEETGSIDKKNPKKPPPTNTGASPPTTDTALTKQTDGPPGTDKIPKLPSSGLPTLPGTSTGTGTTSTPGSEKTHKDE